MKKTKHHGRYLACERKRIYQLLMMAGGMMGAYTYLMRGGVFCNAQTANFVLMAMALGKKQWLDGLYFLIPITAYIYGAIVSEFLPTPVKRIGLLRWDTYLIGAESIILTVVGFIPLTVTDHIVQIIINFICSMQYNTFRKAEGIPMATTFCTNHVRQIGVSLSKYVKHRETESLRRLLTHITMVLCFLIGGVIITVFSSLMQEKVIWMAVIPLLITFIILAYADIFEERHRLDEIPDGH